MIVPVLAAMLAAGEAQADGTGWDTFAARCLEPMSEVRQPDMSGLEPGGAARMAELMQGENPSATVYAVRDRVLLSVLPERDGHFLTCTIVDESDTAVAALDQYETWREEAIVAERWREVTQKTALGPDLYSTTWREPKVALSRWTGADERGRAVLFSIRTTDLES